MGSLGVQEIVFIFILALLIFGPKRLPELGRTVGKGLAEFRKASNDLKRTINAELALEELPKIPSVLTRRVPAGTIAAPLLAAVSALDEPEPAPPAAPQPSAGTPSDGEPPTSGA